MSRASRLARADRQIVKPTPLFDLWANSEAIPGSFDAPVVDRLVHAGGLEWLPCHAGPWSSSIGYALAVETSSPRVSLIKAGASCSA